MSARVAVLTFPGSNSEDETVRACRDAGLTTECVHWTTPLDVVRAFDAYVLPGGFAYEDRVRAGAVAAHDRLMEAVREGAARGKLVLGICNGAQILLEAGLAPGLAEPPSDGPARPEASFTQNAQRAFLCRFVHVKLTVDPSRCAFTAALPADAVIPMWASHGEGRLAATEPHLDAIAAGRHVVFQYADADGNLQAAPNGAALNAAALTNRQGNVLAIMPHAERSAWGYQRVGSRRHELRGNTAAALAPADGSILFSAFARALQHA